jgi:hypothetical protein
MTVPRQRRSLPAATLRVAVAATLAAGAIGALRQRRERDRARAGTMTRAGAAASTLPPPSEDSLSRWLAGWTPEAPRSGPGRILAIAWASPLSMVGLALAATTGGTARWSAEHGCLVVEGAHGGSARFLRMVGAGANAIGHVVVSTYPTTPPVVLAHEAGHVRQAERLGPLLFPLYLWASARYGYRDNPIERGARAAARRWLDLRQAATSRPS